MAFHMQKYHPIYGSEHFMQKSKLGNTDIEVSLLGLGTVKIGRNTGVKYPQPFDIPDDRQVISLFNHASDCGINLIDTAPAYGNSEERLGQLLHKTSQSQKWIVSTKVGESFNSKTGDSTYNFSPDFIQSSIESSLKKLKRDYLDIVLIHSDGNDERIIHSDGALDTLQHLKRKGLIRAIGMSSKTVEGGILAAEHSDMVMVTQKLKIQKI